MAKTTLVVESSWVVPAKHEVAWSLLGSAAAWSLRLGYFAFDALGPDSERMRCVLAEPSLGVPPIVLTVCGEEPGVAVSWRGGRAVEIGFSARPHQRGAVTAIAVRHLVDRAAARRLRKYWDHELGVWLAGVCAVIEGRQPWPGQGMPAYVRRAFADRPALEVTDGVSAAVLIAAPLGVVWEAVWAPETLRLVEPGWVVGGQVPGTPEQEVGEMQYFICRGADSQLTLNVLIVRELSYQHSALTENVSQRHVQTHHLVTPEAGRTRLELTHRWAKAAMTVYGEQLRNVMSESVQTMVNGYKSAIEEPPKA